MSELEDVVSLVYSVSEDTKNSAMAVLACEKRLEREMQAFLGAVDGTRDSAKNQVVQAFTTARKKLLEAARAMTLAAKTGEDWCGDKGPVHVLSKRR